MSYGEITVIIVAQTFQHLPVHILKDANATHQCIANDDIINVTSYAQLLRFQLIYVIQLRLTNLLLDSVEDQIGFRAV